MAEESLSPSPPPQNTPSEEEQVEEEEPLVKQSSIPDNSDRQSPVPDNDERESSIPDNSERQSSIPDHSDRQSSVPDHSDENEATKIIVLQLSFGSTEETVHEYFSKFGEIEKLDLKRYPDGTSRGFAFIIFKTEDTLAHVLGEQDHSIDNRRVTVEKARTRSEKMQTNKIFIGKLPSELTEEHLRDYFSEFGEIEEIQFVFNKQTRERKSFCFIQFKFSDAVEKITESKVPPESTRHTIQSFEIECKKKFDDSHPIQRKIKAIERQKKGWDYYGNHGNNYGNNAYDYNSNYGGPYYGYGHYGGHYGGPPHRDMYYNGYEEYNNAYNGYYNNGNMGKTANGGSRGNSRGNKNSTNNSNYN